MNIVILEGTLSSEPVLRTLSSGSLLHQFEVTTRDAEVASTVPVAWFDPAVPPTFTKGSSVVVVGTVRRRFFRGAAGTQSRTEVVATEVLPSTKKAKVNRVLRRQAEILGGAAGADVRSV